MSTLQSLLEKFCNRYTLTMPEMDKDQNYHVNFSSSVSFYIRTYDAGFYVQSVLHDCPKENKEDIYIHLMAANLLQQGTGKSVIGADFQGNFLTLSMAIAYEVNDQEFQEEMEEFINYLIFWRKEIQKLIQEAKERST